MPKRLFNKPHDENAETFGQRLARLRKAAGHTQHSLSTELGISHRMIAHYETEGGNPSVYLLSKIAKVLKVSGDVLLGTNKSVSNNK